MLSPFGEALSSDFGRSSGLEGTARHRPEKYVGGYGGTL